MVFVYKTAPYFEAVSYTEEKNNTSYDSLNTFLKINQCFKITNFWIGESQKYFKRTIAKKYFIAFLRRSKKITHTF